MLIDALSDIFPISVYKVASKPQNSLFALSNKTYLSIYYMFIIYNVSFDSIKLLWTDHYQVNKNCFIYRTRAIITRSWLETALEY